MTGRGRRFLAPVALAAFLAAVPGCRSRQADLPAAAVPASPTPAAAPTPLPGRLFADVTEAAGIDFVHVNGGTGKRYLPETMGAGGCALDYDGDGHLDLYLVQSGAVPGAPGATTGPALTSRLWRNRGDGTFEDVTERSRTGVTGYGQGAVSADYDNDGRPDIYVVNFGPNVLLHNNGDGTFTDVTRKAGVGDPRWGSSAAFLDGDGDGHLDLYVANYLDFTVAKHQECGRAAQGQPAYCHPDAYEMAPDIYYRNRGDGTFLDATRAAGLVETTGKGLGVVATDFDNDGDPDIYVANDSTPNFLFVNQGGGKFEESGVLLGVSHNEEGRTEAGMGVDGGDVNEDGWPDIFVTNLSNEPNSLYLGGAVAFTYATRQAGLYGPSLPWVGFGTDLLDLDNDGHLDLIVVNGHVIDNIELFSDNLRYREPGQAFLGDGHGHFAELDAARTGDLAVARVARTSITLDYDNDGQLDELVTYNNDKARLYRNVLSPAGNWIGFSLRGRAAGRDALGARVTVEAGGRRLTEEKKAGSSYQGSNDPRLHFGLGAASEAERVTVVWPGGAKQQLDRLAGGRYYQLLEGESPTPLPR